LRSVLAITFGPLDDRWSGIKDARFIEAVPMVALTAFIVLLGVYPSVLTDIMQNGFSGLLDQIQQRTGG
jgi:NADH-quinone oxidoreductase subunit M